MPRWLATMLFCAALGGAFWRLPGPGAPGFTAPASSTARPLPALFSSSLLATTGAPAEPSLTLLPDGRIAAAWSADSPDEAGQRSIWFSILAQDGWRPPLSVASRESTAAGTFTHAGKLGQPLLHAEGGWLHLWYTSRDGLAGATLNHSVSTNSGQSWNKPEKLEIAPLAGGDLGLVAPPLSLDDGGLGLTLSHAFIGGHSTWLRLSATGKILARQRLPQAAPGQPAAIATLDTRHALALLRNAASGQLQVASSADGGDRWQAGPTLPIAIADRRPALLRTASGRLLLAANPASGQATLQLWLSADAGRSWQSSRSIEDAADPAADFSEPALLLGRDGRIHLAYRWRHQAVRIASFSEAWLDGGAP